MMAKVTKVTNKTSVLILGLTVLLLAGCSGGGSAADASRLQLQNRQLSIVNNTGSSVSSQAITTTPSLSLVATITPPTVNGVVLQANNTSITGTNVYVSYNLAGTASGGGVDQVNVATTALPILSSSQYFPTMDVNAALYSNGSIYVAGNSSVTDAPARLQKYSASILGAFNGLTTDLAMPGYASVAVKSDLLSNYLYAVTGDNSGLQVIPQGNFATTTVTALADARDVAVSTVGLGNIYVVTGGANGMVKGFTNTGAAITTGANGDGSVSIGNTGASQSKSTIQAGAFYAVASAGSQGVKVICLQNMSVVGSALPATTGGLTNSAAFVGGFVYTSDGDGSVNVYSMNLGSVVTGAVTCNNLTLTKVGSINFGANVSANNVSVVGGALLFVSAGIGGFQIISVTPPTLTTGLLTSL